MVTFCSYHIYMTLYCVSINKQTTGKCNLFVLYNKIEENGRIKQVNSLFLFLPKHLEVKFHAYMIYTNNEMLLVRLSNVLNYDWLSLECATR